MIVQLWVCHTAIIEYTGTLPRVRFQLTAAWEANTQTQSPPPQPESDGSESE